MNTNLSISVENQNNDIRKIEEINTQNMDTSEELEGLDIDTSQIIIEKITYSICALIFLFMIVVSAWSAVIYIFEIDCKTTPLQYCLEPLVKKCLN